MSKISRQDVEAWLMNNKDLFNNEAMDRRLKFPPGTIQKFIKYNRELSDKRILALSHLLTKICVFKKQ